MAQAPRSSKLNSEPPAKQSASGGGGGDGVTGIVAVTVGGGGGGDGGGTTTPGPVEMVPGGAPGVAGAVSGETAPATPPSGDPLALSDALLAVEQRRGDELEAKVAALTAELRDASQRNEALQANVAALNAEMVAMSRPELAAALKDARRAADTSAHSPLPVDDGDIGALAEALGVELLNILAVNMDTGVIVTRDGRKLRLAD